MPDPRFFRRAGPFTVQQLAARVGGELVSGAPALPISDIGSLDSAEAADITYVADQRYVLALAASRCGACITKPEFAKRAPHSCAVIAVADPRAAFAEVASAYYPELPPQPQQRAIAADAQI